MENLYLFIFTACKPETVHTSGLRAFSQKDVSARTGCIDRFPPSTLRRWSGVARGTTMST